MGTRGYGHILGRLLWHLNGPRGRVVPFQHLGRADVLRVDHVVFGHCHFVWEAGGHLADGRGIDGVFDCVELRRVRMSPSFMADERTYTDVALKTTALSPPKFMQNETGRRGPGKKGCEGKSV